MLKFENWGLVDYETALSRQLEYVEKVASTKEPGYLIFCTHPPIVTLGRKTQPGDVFAWQGAIKEISRGGRATYHGPSQLVVYPIVNLELAGSERPAKDIGALLRLTENAIVQTLKKIDINATGKTTQKKNADEAESEETGVWIENRKIASLGIGVKKWVSYHGAAINLQKDPNAFSGMKPCGFSSETMTSAEEYLNKKIDQELFSLDLKNLLLNSL